MTSSSYTKGAFHVLIAGGGVAGLEAALALRELAAEQVATTMIAPDPEFVYRPRRAVVLRRAAARSRRAPLPPYKHTITIDDRRLDELLHGLIQDIEGGYVRRLAFVIPSGKAWPLPIYPAVSSGDPRTPPDRW
jgi:sulfide:quinone oxidoreductase